MKTQEEVEAQILKIKKSLEELPDDDPTLIYRRTRLQALKWVLKP